MLKKIGDWFYQQSVQKRLLYLGFAVSFLLVFALNYLFPIYADDMMYSVVKHGESVDISKNFDQIFSFLHYYYFNWGGRIVAHFFAHVLLLFNTIGQDVINSAVFCILLWLIYKFTRYDKENNFFLFLFISLAVFYFTPSFLSSAIWKTGSANYLWCITLILFFLYYYYNYYNGKEYKDSIFKIVLFFLLGLIVGCTNENLAPVTILIALVYIYMYRKDRKIAIPRWAISGLIGLVIGCSLMILAPGNAVRAELEGYPSLFSSWDTIIDRLPQIWGSYRYFMLRLIILYVVCLALNYVFPKDVSKREQVVLQSVIFFLAANISIWVTLMAPSFPPRAFMSITILTIVAVGMLYANIDFKKIIPKILNFALLAALICYSSIDYVTFLKGSYFLHNQMDVREHIIDEAKAKGETSVTLEAIHLDYRFEYSDFANYYKDYYNIDATFVED